MFSLAFFVGGLGGCVMLVVLGVFFGVLLSFLVVLVLGRFDVSRLKEGLRGLQRGPVVAREVPEGLSAEPFRLFVLLQRECRLLDLLLEDIGDYSDGVVGAAARPVLLKARSVLRDYVSLESIMGLKEGESVTVEEGYDPSEVCLVGSVGGVAPFVGTLCHPGWRVVAHRIPKAAPGGAGLVVERAQVELG